MMSQDRKVVFLGFCSGNQFLIHQWANDGILPTFRRLFRQGFSSNTTSLPGYFVGSTWPSFYTAVSPARHSRYYQSQLVPGTYKMENVKAGERVRREPFWNILSQAGHQIAVLDIPHSTPSENLSGIQLAAWDVHDADYDHPVSWPPDLAKKVVSRYGLNPAGGTCDAWRDTADFVQFRKNLLAGVERKLELTQDLLKQEDWNFFAQVFTEGHCAGHQCWHFHDSSHPAHNAAATDVVGDPLRDTYVAIDSAIGKIVEELNSETTVMVFISHGMGPKYSAQVFLDRILIALGLATPRRGQDPNRKAESRSHLGRLDPVLTRAYQHIPQSVRDRLQPVRDRVRQVIDRQVQHGMTTLDPSGSRCFGVYNNSAHSGIRVNLVGREPEGKVSPGAELRALRASLERDLLEIVNVDTGMPIVRRVVHTASTYRGDYLDYLPDFSIEWSVAAPIRCIASPKIGEIHDDNRASRTGDHIPGGLLIATGPSITPGSLRQPISVMDVAPTITRMLGVELEDVDGRPIDELCYGYAALR
jgi:predicted AlkP superfamily phosphohydrolase/phosphomutase